MLELNEIVGMKDFEIVPFPNVSWKIFPVEGDDSVSPAMNCCCEHMTIVGVGKLEYVDQLFISGNEAIEHRRIHQSAGSHQLFALDI